MKSRKSKSLIAVLVTAIIAVVCGVCALTSATSRSTDKGFFKGSYNLNAYAAVTTDKINVAGHPVDVVKTMSLDSIDGNYTLYITIIDTADLAGLNVHLGYDFGEDLYFNGCGESGFSNVVYSSLSSGEGETLSTLNVSDFGLDADTFQKPYFAIVEVAKSSILDKIGSLIIAEKHNLEKVSGTASTCSVAGWKDYYTCSDEGCTKYYADKWGVKEIADLETWKTGEGQLALAEHTAVVDEAVAPTCTESGLTQGSHCSVCEAVIVAQQVDPAKGHTPVELPAEDASCTEGGLTAGSYCSVCNTVLKAQSTIPANGHTEVVDEAVAATCTQTGLTEGKHCSDCGEILVAQTETTALGHHYVNHICDRDGCGDLEKYEVAGVYYQLTAANEKYNGYHFVACGKADTFNSLYTGENAQTLILENVIDGYPVTEIAANAFANTDDEESTAIKSVIVPKNIVMVGEKAFYNNYGIERVIFLAQTVHLNGSGGNANSTYPFYGCSTYKSDAKVDGKKGNEITKLNIYYNSITAKDSSDWKLFRYVYNGWWYSFYIQDEGGAIYSTGWNYVTANATVDLKGVTDSELTLDAVNAILAKYYPMINATTYDDSDERKTIEANLTVEFAKYDINKNGITYKCVWEPNIDTVDGYKVVTYSVSYTSAAILNVYSPMEFTYYGTKIEANTLTTIVVEVEGDSFNLATPSLTTHNFVQWNVTEEDGKTVYTAVWSAKEFKLNLYLRRGGTDTNIFYVDSTTYRVNGKGITSTDKVTEITIYGGEASFTVSDKVLTIVTGNVTYTIYVNEASVTGKDKYNKRNISSDINGTIVISSDMDLTLRY